MSGDASVRECASTEDVDTQESPIGAEAQDEGNPSTSDNNCVLQNNAVHSSAEVTANEEILTIDIDTLVIDDACRPACNVNLENAMPINDVLIKEVVVELNHEVDSIDIIGKEPDSTIPLIEVDTLNVRLKDKDSSGADMVDTLSNDNETIVPVLTPECSIASLDIIKLSTDENRASCSKTSEDTTVTTVDSTGVQPQSIYQIKWVKWKDTKVPVITQNENGPCPLIAIMNVLLLIGKVKLSYAVEIITSDQLMEYLGDCILDSAPKNISEGAQLNYEQNMHDAIAVLPKLQTGLDVNVKFTGVHDFEYTPECIIFDLLNIPLVHGWLVDPQARDIVSAVGKLSYNQLVEKIITNKSSSNSELVTEALIAENFLEKSASQLTYYGLCELNEILKANELAVLFRNNHFSTVFKHEGELLQLVTDQGFLNESNVVWETLSNIEGDCQFVDANFVTVPPKATAAAINLPPGVDLEGEEQIQHDYLVALSLQEEQKREEEKAKLWQAYKEKQLGITDEMTDEELARRLHADEQRLANQQAQAEGAAAPQRDPNGAAAVAAVGIGSRQSSTDSKSAGKSDKKKSDCIIL